MGIDQTIHDIILAQEWVVKLYKLNERGRP